MTISAWLSDASKQLVEAGIDSARLDAEIILAHTLKQRRTYVHAHSGDEIEPRLEEVANARLDLRSTRVPLAYIIGHKEFYGRLFYVTPRVLVPRPESEEIITQFQEILGDTKPLPHMPTLRLVDIGTGSGCLGITAKLLHLELEVSLCDNSKSALKVAEKNARALDANVEIIESNLLESYPYSPDFVFANLPYVDETWEHSPEIEQEPPEALYAAKSGLAVIERCFEQLSHRMKPGGVAIFEADPRQWTEIINVAKSAGFVVLKTGRFAYSFRKI